ncbi:MAG TPA: ferrochelatase [Gemmatimonadales bacterium]|nr:ferrochelatase [Gemmatimonadales bacterium]
MPVTHLVLVNLGTPEAPEPASVREFLDEFLGDPAVVDLPRWLWLPILRGIILRRRPARVAEQYRSIWTDGGSPLRVATERIVADVRARAAGRFGVSSAYRYGEPSLDTVMQRLAREESGPIVVSPLFPHRTDATTGTAFLRAREAAERAGIAHRLVERLVDPAAPGYISAMAARWRRDLDSAGHDVEHLVISFHGIPVRYDRRERGVYVRDCRATTDAFLRAIDWPADRATLAFQSKFGPEPWLKPATAGLLEELPRRGVRRVAVITPGFVTEGLETVEEIGIRGRESFIEAGGTEFLRIGSVELEPEFLDELAALATTSNGRS